MGKSRRRLLVSGWRFIVWLETHLSPNLSCHPALNVIVMSSCHSCALYVQPLGDSRPLHLAWRGPFILRPLASKGSGRAPRFFVSWTSSPVFNFTACHPRLLPQEMEITVNSGGSSLTRRAGLCHINFCKCLDALSHLFLRWRVMGRYPDRVVSGGPIGVNYLYWLSPLLLVRCAARKLKRGLWPLISFSKSLC